MSFNPPICGVLMLYREHINNPQKRTKHSRYAARHCLLPCSCDGIPLDLELNRQPKTVRIQVRGSMGPGCRKTMTDVSVVIEMEASTYFTQRVSCGEAPPCTSNMTVSYSLA
ncbi:hypothetical protein TNCV_2725811 [Trichonephila clavipes]|nr:hypothetical protein TNCV_2725811 [Trichonephila clavipes]